MQIEPPKLLLYSEATRAIVLTDLGRKAAQAVRLDSDFRSATYMLELDRARHMRPSPAPRFCTQVVGLFVTELCDAALGAVHTVCASLSAPCP